MPTLTDQTVSEDSWDLEQCYLTSQIERLDHPRYFHANFACPDIDRSFLSIATRKEVQRKRNLINLFYQSMLAIEKPSNPLYVRLKWLTYQHSLISKYDDQSPLFPYTLKALLIYSQNFDSVTYGYGPYEKYLSKILVKPYLQYLSKFCLLCMPDGGHYGQTPQTLMKEPICSDLSESEAKQSHSPGKKDKKFTLKLQKIQTLKHDRKISTPVYDSQVECIDLKVTRWYRIYNFVMSSLQIFDKPLLQCKNYFSQHFPYLNSISSLIIHDLNTLISKLKFDYHELKKVNVTLMEIDQLQTKFRSFNQRHIDFLEEEDESLSVKLDYTKAEITQFLCSPLKPPKKSSCSSRKKNYEERTCASASIQMF